MGEIRQSLVIVRVGLMRQAPAFVDLLASSFVSQLTGVERRLHERPADAERKGEAPELGDGRGDGRGLRVGGRRHRRKRGVFSSSS